MGEDDPSVGAAEDPDDDDDLLDGCELDFCEDPCDDEVVALLPLFPSGDPAAAGEWKELFG